MTAFNVVRFRVKPGQEKDFEQQITAADTEGRQAMIKNGFRKASLIKTGDRAYCFIGEWESFDSIVKSRPDMIKQLDSMRDMLEDLGGGLGVTDPVSGEVVGKINPGM